MGLYDIIVIPHGGGHFQTKKTVEPHFETFHIGDRIECPDGVHGEDYGQNERYWFHVHHRRLLYAGRQPPSAFDEKLPWDAPARYQFDPAAEALQRIYARVALDEFGSTPAPLKEFVEQVAVQGLLNFLDETGQHQVLPPDFEAEFIKRRHPRAPPL